MVLRDQQREKPRRIPGNPVWVCHSVVESLAGES